MFHSILSQGIMSTGNHGESQVEEDIFNSLYVCVSKRIQKKTNILKNPTQSCFWMVSLISRSLAWAIFEIKYIIINEQDTPLSYGLILSESLILGARFSNKSLAVYIFNVHVSNRKWPLPNFFSLICLPCVFYITFGSFYRSIFSLQLGSIS